MNGSASLSVDPSSSSARLAFIGTVLIGYKVEVQVCCWLGRLWFSESGLVVYRRERTRRVSKN